MTKDEVLGVKRSGVMSARMRCKDIPKYILLCLQGPKYCVLRKVIFAANILLLSFKTNLYLFWSLH